MKHILSLLLIGISAAAVANAPYASMGGRAGEVSANAARLQVRLGTHEGQKLNFAIDPSEGEARVVLSTAGSETRAFISDWQQADLTSDSYLQFSVTGLKAHSDYEYFFEMRAKRGDSIRQSPRYQFRTAPAADQDVDISGHIVTCHSHQGLPIFDVMRRQSTDFMISTGDNVYYDKYDVRSVQEAFWLYQKDWGTPYSINYLASRAAYFMKDDHDYRYNDADPFSKGDWYQPRSWEGYNGLTEDLERADSDWLTHEEGIRVFKTVFPSSELPYRTFRWGRGVQVWLLEGRDFRSKNSSEDSASKTIWGAKQKQWLQQSLQASDAKFRIIVSPTPLIGPDKPEKSDNHANRDGFLVEGRAFMDWLIDQGLANNTFIVCGDRHWQYHSLYREKVHEFCVGPTSAYRALPVVTNADSEIRQVFSLSTGGFFRFEYHAANDAIDLVNFDEHGKETYRFKLSVADHKQHLSH